MKHQIGSVELAIWIAIVVGKVILCLCLIKRGMPRRLPWFSTYIFGTTANSLLLFSLSQLGSYAAYYYTFTLTNILEAALALFTLMEFAGQVLPGFKLLPRSEAALSWLVAALGAVVVFVGVWSFRYAEKRAQVAAYFVVAIAFIVVAVYARWLRLSWSRILGGVSLTLGGLYLTEGVARVVMGYYPSPHPVWLVARQSSEIASLLAVISWTIFVLIPWGEYPMTEEDLAKVQAIVSAAEENVRSFVASGER